MNIDWIFSHVGYESRSMENQPAPPVVSPRVAIWVKSLGPIVNQEKTGK